MQNERDDDVKAVFSNPQRRQQKQQQKYQEQKQQQDEILRNEKKKRMDWEFAQMTTFAKKMCIVGIISWFVLIYIKYNSNHIMECGVDILRSREISFINSVCNCSVGYLFVVVSGACFMFYVSVVGMWAMVIL